MVLFVVLFVALIVVLIVVVFMVVIVVAFVCWWLFSYLNYLQIQMLVSSKIKAGTHQFEVHKQGILLLRNFKNKRVHLRIVFNIIQQPTTTLDNFNSNFLNQLPALDPPNPCLALQQGTCQLHISPCHKELSNNRILLFLNAYQNSPGTHLLIIGYLVASLFLYHHYGALGEDSQLTGMLGGLRGMLMDTCVHSLEEEVKYKSGCKKKPYFMCLFRDDQGGGGSGENCHDVFREFYKYQEGKDKLNESVDALIDYFPERSAMRILNYENNKQSQQLVSKLGQEYLQGIMGRQIFNFQITGSTLENLCFELCEVFNSQSKGSIDLVKIYTKIINNQKMRVFDNSSQNYSSLMAQLNKNMPYEPSQLLQSCKKIQKHIIGESMAQACNCMIFSQYETIYEKLQNIIEKKEKLAWEENKEMLRNRTLACYSQIQEDELLEKMLQEMGQHNCGALLEAIGEKIQTFVTENVHEFTVRDMLIRLVNKYVQQYGEGITELLATKQKSQRELADRCNKLEMENKVLQAKCRELENEYMCLDGINREFKQKLMGLNNGSNGGCNVEDGNGDCIEVVGQLRRKITELQVQINQKNSVIQNLYEIVDKFDVEFNRKFYKPKFNKDIQNLLTQITYKINDIYSVFNQLKKTQQFYMDIQSEFESKKSSFDKIREAQKLELSETRQKMNQIVKEKACIQQIAQEGRNTVQVMEEVLVAHKDGISSLEGACSRFKCLLADTEGDFQKYKKALELVVIFGTTGKIDKLRDFYKVSTQQDLKQILKPLFKK